MSHKLLNIRIGIRIFRGKNELEQVLPVLKPLGLLNH